MKKYLVPLLILPIVSYAQEQTLEPLTATRIPVACGKTRTALEVMSKYEEELIWSGNEINGSVISVWQNKITKSFTVLKTANTGDFSCVISMSEGTNKGP